MTPYDLSVRFFLEAALILATCRLTGLVFARLGQSQVVSEMIAGVLLGPSLLGSLAPDLSAYLFPPETRPILYVIAQLGLVLYMFLVGTEFDLGLLRSRWRSAAMVSAAGIVVPFVLGALLALYCAGDPRLFSPATTTGQAVLFFGAAMSITAFPMLARLIVEQGLARTSLGALALAAGSLDDVAAWMVLAIVLASFGHAPAIAIYAIGGGVLFALVVLGVLRPLLRPLGSRIEAEGRLDMATLVTALMLLMLGAWFTDAIQIYAVFGAFLMGAAMPRGRFAAELVRSIKPLTLALLLPFFFVYSGLNTRLGLVNTPSLWLLAALVLLAATAGKAGACYVAARLAGEPHRDALAIGTLMNARGLMELIIRNIGLSRGLIQPALFAIMVTMAVATTLATTPVFTRLHGRRAEGLVP